MHSSAETTDVIHRQAEAEAILQLLSNLRMQLVSWKVKSIWTSAVWTKPFTKRAAVIVGHPLSSIILCTQTRALAVVILLGPVQKSKDRARDPGEEAGVLGWLQGGLESVGNDHCSYKNSFNSYSERSNHQVFATHLEHCSKGLSDGPMLAGKSRLAEGTSK